MKILIDNGHGSDTENKGKFSPLLDFYIPSEFTNGNRFREWKYNRVISRLLVEKLKSYGRKAELVVPEDRDIPLSERIRRVNTICDKEGAGNTLWKSRACLTPEGKAMLTPENFFILTPLKS